MDSSLRPPPASTVEYDTNRIFKQRLLHKASCFLNRIVPTKGTRELEFECRYRRYLAEYGESDSDVIVSTYSKSGTTWTQIILYQLTTQGVMDFDHLFDISPWIWYASLRKTVPVNPQEPRILKSHDDYRRFSNGRKGRFLFVLRDGRDVCISLYHHRRNFKRFEGSFEEHFEEFLYGKEYNWFDHVRSWLENKYNLEIMNVRFEDLKFKFEETVRTIADFCEIDINDEIMHRTKEKCSFAAMKQHEHQLGPRNSHFAGLTNTPYFVKNPDQFIRRGDVGEGLEVLNEEQLSAYRKRFDQSLAEFELISDYR